MNVPIAAFMQHLDNRVTRLLVQSNYICYVLQPLWQSISQLIPAMAVRATRSWSHRYIYIWFYPSTKHNIALMKKTHKKGVSLYVCVCVRVFRQSHEGPCFDR